MERKELDLLVKEAPSDVPGIVAYASTFDRIPDAYGDVVAKGAFAKSIQAIKDSGNNLPLLYGHVMDDPANIIGTVTDLREDDHGLLIKADFDMENPMAQQVHRSVLSKAITKLSFAFSVLDQAPVTLEDGTKANELRELEIYEVSLVVVPANPRAQVIAAKDATEVKSDELTEPVDDTETEPEIEAKAEEPDGAKVEEPMVEDEVEETPTETKSTQESENQMENIIETIGGAAPVAEKGLKDIISETIAQKGGSSRFHLTTPEIKAATWMGAPTIQEYSHRVTNDFTPMLGIADLFNQYVLSEGNTYVYVPLQEKDGDFDVVAEGGEKPLIDYAKTPVAKPLQNVAGILKVSEQCIEDAAWLVSAIEGRGVNELRGTVDGIAYVAVSTASGINAVTATSDMMADILTAIGAIMTASGKAADAILMNPADYYALIGAERSKPTSLFGPDYRTILGVQVIPTSVVTASTCLVGAFKYGATMATKGGIKVDMTNSNEDDFIHNLVAIRIEERVAFACEVPAAFALIS